MCVKCIADRFCGVIFRDDTQQNINYIITVCRKRMEKMQFPTGLHVCCRNLKKIR